MAATSVLLALGCRGTQPGHRVDNLTAERLAKLGAGDPARFFPRAHPEAQVKRDEGKVVIVMPSRGQAHELNETGGRLFLMLDGRHSVPDLAHALVRDYDVDYPTAFRDAVEFLVALHDKGMLDQPTRKATDTGP